MPDEQVLQKLETAERAREEARNNITRIFESIQSSGILEAVKHAQSLGEQFVKVQERIRNMYTLPTFESLSVYTAIGTTTIGALMSCRAS